MKEGSQEEENLSRNKLVTNGGTRRREAVIAAASNEARETKIEVETAAASFSLNATSQPCTVAESLLGHREVGGSILNSIKCLTICYYTVICILFNTLQLL